MRTTVIEPPATLPLTWDTVKQHLRLDDLGDQNAPEQSYIMDVLVPAAARTATRILRRALIETEYETDCLPAELRRADCSLVLVLPWPDLIAVESVLYGDLALVEDTDYQIVADADGVPTQPGTLRFSAGVFGDACCGGHWYSPGYGCPCLCAQETLRVIYRAGYGTVPEDIPADVQAWMLLRVGTLYENREETTSKTGSIDTMPFVDSLLMDRHFEFS